MNHRTTRRTPSETIKIHLYLHFGFSQSVLKDAKVREDKSKFSKKSIERAKEQISGRCAHQMYKWPTKPVSKQPGKTITSNTKLIEYSLLSAAMHYLFEDAIYDELSLSQVIDSFDLYTNIRSTSKNLIEQLSPDNAYWVSKEFSTLTAVVLYCNDCQIRYYSSVEQKIKNSCPWCKCGNYQDIYHYIEKLR